MCIVWGCTLVWTIECCWWSFTERWMLCNQIEKVHPRPPPLWLATCQLAATHQGGTRTARRCCSPGSTWRHADGARSTNAQNPQHLEMRKMPKLVIRFWQQLLPFCLKGRILVWESPTVQNIILNNKCELLVAMVRLILVQIKSSKQYFDFLWFWFGCKIWQNFANWFKHAFSLFRKLITVKQIMRCAFNSATQTFIRIAQIYCKAMGFEKASTQSQAAQKSVAIFRATIEVFVTFWFERWL